MSLAAQTVQRSRSHVMPCVSSEITLAQEAWEDDDGTVLGTLGYAKVLESPLTAYRHLQAEFFAVQQACSQPGSPDAAVRLLCHARQQLRNPLIP